jgi:PD-(D/E)XK nuclease superfamily
MLSYRASTTIKQTFHTLQSVWLSMCTELGPGLLESAYDAQVLTYMKLANKSVSLLINFNVPVLKMGLKRFVR